jgi:hypothetical protein
MESSILFVVKFQKSVTLNIPHSNQKWTESSNKENMEESNDKELIDPWDEITERLVDNGEKAVRVSISLGRNYHRTGSGRQWGEGSDGE